MARAYANGLGGGVAQAGARGGTCRETARLFEVSVSSVVKWSQRRRSTGSAAALPMGGKRGRELEPHRGWLLERLACEPHVTLRVLSAELAERGISAFHRPVGRLLKEPGSRFTHTLSPS